MKANDETILLRAQDWCKDNLIKYDRGTLMHKTFRRRLESELGVSIDKSSGLWQHILQFVRDYYDIEITRTSKQNSFTRYIGFADTPPLYRGGNRSNHVPGMHARDKALGRLP